jgi:hypothetical protein
MTQTFATPERISIQISGDALTKDAGIGDAEGVRRNLYSHLTLFYEPGNRPRLSGR